MDLTPEATKEAENKILKEVGDKITPILEKAGVMISGVIVEVPNAPGFYTVQPLLKIKPKETNEKKDDTAK